MAIANTMTKMPSTRKTGNMSAMVVLPNPGQKKVALTRNSFSTSRTSRLCGRKKTT